jgi:hypothetical protein
MGNLVDGGILATAALWFRIQTSFNNKMDNGVAKKVKRKYETIQIYI